MFAQLTRLTNSAKLPTVFFSVCLDMDSSSEWVLLNVAQAGYYRVNYDDVTWARLAGVLRSNHEMIGTKNRAQLIDDSFNLARSSN